MADELPQEALVRVFHFLPIKQRSRFACACKAWRQAASVDAVLVKLQKQHVPSYLHVALPDGAAQLQAAACPMMSLARSADFTWASAAATGSLLESMPSLERLAFTSMSSVPQPGNGSGLQSLKSLTNLQSLQLNTCDAAPLLEAMPSVPHSVREIELHLTGEDWQTSALDKIADQLGSQATRLRSLVLRCSHASVYAATQPLESLSRLTGLTSLRMGPNQEDVFPHTSPLGFPRLPSFLQALQRLQHLDISIADSAATAASLPGMSFNPIRHIPDVKLTLRADTSIRAVQQLPASIAAVAGLSSLTVQAFTFEDPGGWCTTAYFNLGPLASCQKLRHLELQLGTWECEHCEAFELPGLQELSQLQSLKVLVTSRSVSLGQPGPEGAGQVQEVLLALPGMRPAQQLHISTSMRVVLRNSKVLARAADPGVLAHSILLEEPLPQRKTAAAASAAASTSAAATPSPIGSKAGSSSSTSDAAHTKDQAAAAAASSAAVGQPPQQPQFVRAPAHVVISALRNLWPGMEVWQYPVRVPGISSRQHVAPQLLCKVSSRDEMQQQLWQALVGAGGIEDLEDAGDVSGTASGGMRLW